MSAVNSQCQVKSLAEVLQDVRELVEIECFDGRDRKFAEELCLIIAEIHRLPLGTSVRIGGDDLPIDLVRDVYSGLRNEHVAAVIEKYSRSRYPIKYKKTYIRTALYNQMFEQESGEVNDFNSTFPR